MFMVFCSRAYCLKMCPYQLSKVIRVQVMLILLFRLTDREITDREILISMVGLSCGYSWLISPRKMYFLLKTILLIFTAIFQLARGKTR